MYSIIYSLININLFILAYGQDYGFVYFIGSEFLRILYSQGFHDLFVFSGLFFGELMLSVGGIMGYLVYSENTIQKIKY